MIVRSDNLGLEVSSCSYSGHRVWFQQRATGFMKWSTEGMAFSLVRKPRWVGHGQKESSLPATVLFLLLWGTELRSWHWTQLSALCHWQMHPMPHHSSRLLSQTARHSISVAEISNSNKGIKTISLTRHFFHWTLEQHDTHCGEDTVKLVQNSIPWILCSQQHHLHQCQSAPTAPVSPHHSIHYDGQSG